MAHNFIQNDDIMADPDMEIYIDFKKKIVSARNYQLDSLGIYKQVYNNSGTSKNYKLERELNLFLSNWINNISLQEYELKVK
jgi:hypothetical protein